MSTQQRVNLPSVVASPVAAMESSLNSGQQAQPVAIIRGGQRVPLVWVTPIYNLRNQPTPGGQTGKK